MIWTFIVISFISMLITYHLGYNRAWEDIKRYEENDENNR